MFFDFLFRKTYLVTIHGEPNSGTFWFRVQAKNGEPLVTSETYTRREDAERAAVNFTKARLVMG